MRSEKWIAAALTALLLLPVSAVGQQPNPAVAGGLRVVAVRGDGSRNDISIGTATPPTVRILDDAEKPVAGAEVLFEAPSSGPSGLFSEWLTVLTTRTNNDGIAVANGFRPNEQEGRFEINVTARQGDRTGRAVLSQTNYRGVSAVKSRRPLWITLGVVGAAAIVGGVLASRNGNGSSSVSATPVTIAPGTITVGGPR